MVNTMKINKYIITSILQIFIYGGVLFILLTFTKPFLANSFFQLFCYFILPIISAILLHAFKRKNTFHFYKENIRSKYAICRFLTHLGVIVIYLFLGYIIDRLNIGNALANIVYEPFSDTAYAFCYLNAFITISLFPLFCEIIEYLFDNISQNSTL